MGTTTFVWDPVFDCVLMELDETDNVKAVYTNEARQYGGVLSQRRGNTSHYHHHDALGSTRFLTDSTGNVTDTYLNDAWGNSVASTGTTVNPFNWVGKHGYYTDNSTGQVYVRARMYQPTVARWSSVDPLFPIDQTAFVYCRNHPVMKNDLLGLYCTDCERAPTEVIFHVPNQHDQSNWSSIPADPDMTKWPGLLITQSATTQGECGAFRWDIKWAKREVSRDYRFVLQHIKTSFDVYTCDGVDITAETAKKIDGRTPVDFYEAWEFPPNSQEVVDRIRNTINFADDTYGSRPVPGCTRGRWTMLGKYTECLGRIPHSMQKGAVRESGHAESSFSKPACLNPTTHAEKPEAEWRNHSLWLKWECCTESE